MIHKQCIFRLPLQVSTSMPMKQAQGLWLAMFSMADITICGRIFDRTLVEQFEASG
jgi:hypothetical protein